MKKDKIIGVIVFLVLWVIFYYFITQNKPEQSQVDQNVQSSQVMDPSRMNDSEAISFVFDKLGLNINNYNAEDVSTSKLEFSGDRKEHSKNYEKFTIKNINDYLDNSKDGLDLKKLIEKFGEPDSIQINNSFRNPSFNYTSVTIVYNKENNEKFDVTDRIVAVSDVDLSGHGKIRSFSGEVSDSIKLNGSGQKENQIFYNIVDQPTIKKAE